MPYNTSNETLRRLTKDAFSSSPDIIDGAKQAGVSLEWLEGQVVKNRKEVLESAAEQIAQYNKLDAKYQEACLQDYWYKPKKPTWLRIVDNLLIWVPLLLAGTLLVLLVILRVRTGGWISAIRMMVNEIDLISPVEASTFTSFLSIAFVSGLIAYVTAKYEYKKRGRKEKSSLQDNVAKLKPQLDEAKKKVDDTLITQGVKPLLKEVINEYVAPPFTTTLPRLNSSGLAEVFDSANEVATAAKLKLDFMLETMPGGSIGIAGPRGAGKSTLLRSACRDSLAPGQPRRLTLFTSAPVEYESRDFVLHLFASVCEKVLEVTGGDANLRESIRGFPGRAGDIGWLMNGLLPVLAMIALYGGTLLLSLGLALAVVLMKGKPATNQPAAGQGQTAAGERAKPAQTQTGEGAAAPAESTGAPASVVTRYVEATGVKPDGLITWGAILLVVYVSILLYYRRSGRLRAISYDEDERDNQAREAARAMGLGPEETERLQKLASEAKRWLRDIRFQQSFTTGWSGAFKLPIGLEGGLTGAESLAQQQMTLPDIVHGLGDFLTGMARDFKVIIGIDEMDKIESDESAQKFLNEIKAIFGLPGVFYLISVSENAMSNFERRGLPFRDVFDSSFDNIIHVDYLDFEAARRVIARRVVGMPAPFSQLCYCLSGGLARDLVRACRNLIELARPFWPDDESLPAVGPNLSALCSSLLSDDLRMKIRATVISAGKSGDSAGANEFIDKLCKMESGLGKSAALLGHYADLVKTIRSPLAPAANGSRPTTRDFMALYDGLMSRPAADDGATRKPDNYGEQICALGGQFATYVYYCATLIDFFGDGLDSTKLADAASDQGIEKLAKARQLISVNQNVSRDLIGQFRQLNELPMPATN